MNTLILMPGSRELTYSLYSDQNQLFCGQEPSYGNHTPQDIAFAVRLVKVTLTGKFRKNRPHLIAVRMVHGGAEFTGPVRFDASVRAILERIIPLAPSRIPAELQLLDSVQEAYPSVPIILLFETSFSTRLPFQEYLYGIPVELSNRLQLRRFSVHGLFHEETCRSIEQDWRRHKEKRRPRILSMCLDPKPEVAAAIGVRPMMSTGGASPLEGIPGQHFCGELDPGVILHLARHLDWAPEKISDVLTNDSGLSALAEREVTVAEVLTSTDRSLDLARDVLRYRLLQACGAGIAVMQRVDVFGYSGSFVQVAPKLHGWLLSQLPSSAVSHLMHSEPVIVAQDIQSILVRRACCFLDTERARERKLQLSGFPPASEAQALNGGRHVSN